MDVEIGHIHSLYRYPVKSMAGEQLAAADLGWYGLEGDRRFAFRRLADQSGFPWLTASKLPALVLYKPVREDPSIKDVLSTHVCTPEGQILPLGSDALRDDIAQRYGGEVQLMRLNQGIFDMATVSLLSLVTSQKITDEAEKINDVRRFRPNIVIHTHDNEPFLEDQWVGRMIIFGDEENSPSVSVTLRDERCMMVNLHPETAQTDAAVLKTVVRLNQNCAGVYATVTRLGALEVGQKVYLR